MDPKVKRSISIYNAWWGCDHFFFLCPLRKRNNRLNTMSRRSKTSFGQNRVSGGDGVFTITNDKVEPLIEAYDDAIRLLEMKRPETDARSAFVLADCSRAVTKERLEACIPELGECPRNIDDFDNKYGSIYAYNSDPTTRAKHPIARCIPAGTGIRREDSKIVDLHSELMRLLVILKEDVGPQLEALMDFHNTIQDCNTYRTQDNCQFPTATDEDGDMVRKCIWNEDGQEGDKCHASHVYAATMAQNTQRDMKSLRAQLQQVRTELRNNPAFRRFAANDKAPYDAFSKKLWQQYKALGDTQRSLESRLTHATDKAQAMRALNSKLRDISKNQIGKKARCGTYDTYGDCGGDDGCAVVVNNGNTGEEGVDRGKITDPSKKADNSINSTSTFCLPKDGDSQGSWYYDTKTGQVHLTNISAMGKSMFDDANLSGQKSWAGWAKGLFSFSGRAAYKDVDTVALLNRMLNDPRKGAKPIAVPAKLRFLQSGMEILKTQLDALTRQKGPYYTRGFTDDEGTFNFMPNFAGAVTPDNKLLKDDDIAWKGKCDQVHDLLRKYKTFADQHHDLFVAEYEHDRDNLLEAMLDDANETKSFQYDKVEEFENHGKRAYALQRQMFKFQKGEQARWFFELDALSDPYRATINKSNEARYGFVTVYMIEDAGNGKTQKFKFAESHLRGNDEDSQSDGALNPEYCLKEYLEPDTAGDMPLMPHIPMWKDGNRTEETQPEEKGDDSGYDVDALRALVAKNRQKVEMAGMDVTSLADLLSNMDLSEGQMFGQGGIDKARRRSAKTYTPWYGAKRYRTPRVRGGDDVKSVATASDHASVASGASSLSGGGDVSLMSTEFPGQPPRTGMNSSVASGTSSLSGGGDLSLMSTEFPGQPPRTGMNSSVASGTSSLSGGDDLSLMSTEFPGQPPRMGMNSSMASSLSGGGDLSLMSTEFPGQPAHIPSANPSTNRSTNPSTSRSASHEELVPSQMSLMSTESPAEASGEKPPMMVPSEATSLDVDRVYEEFYAAGDLESTASSVSHLY